MNSIMSRFNYCVFDLETTGFKPQEGAKIIEVGAVRLDGGEITGRFQQLVDPGETLDREIVELTGISSDELKGQPHYGEVLPEFRRFAGDRFLVAHNSDFDMSFLEKYAEKPFENGVIDTLQVAKTVVNLRDNSLGNLARVFGVELENAHRADEDAEATAKVFKHLWEKMKYRYHYTRSNLPEPILEQAPPPFWKRVFRPGTGEESLFARISSWLISPREQDESS